MTDRRAFLKSIPAIGIGAAAIAACTHSGAQTVQEDVTDPDFELFYTDTGQGDPIVLVPGFTFSGEVFDAQVEAFAKTHRVIVIDPRSHGRSPQTLEGNSYVQHGKDLNDLIEQLDLSNMVLVGWSFGALSAWSYVEQFGLGRVSKFVCIDMPPVPLSAGEVNGDWVELPIDQLPGAYQALSTVEGQTAFIGGYADAIMVQRDLNQADLTWILDLSRKTPPIIAQQLFASGCFSNYLATAQMIERECPSLFVLAEHWAAVAEPYLARVLPKSDVRVLGGHMMFWEYPEKFNGMLRSFLES